MGRSLRLACLAALLVASPVAGQQSWGTWTPGAGAFGYFTWGPPVANLGALPSCVASLTDHARVVSDTGSGDDGIYLCDGSTWGEVGGGGTLVGDVDGPIGSNDLDETAVESELEAVLDIPQLQGQATEAQLASDSVTEAKLKVVNALTDEQCLTAETTTGDFEWQACGGSPGGSAGGIQFNDTGAFGGSASTITSAGSITMAASQTFTASGALQAIRSSDGTMGFYMGGSGDIGVRTGSAWLMRIRDESGNGTIKLSGGGWLCFTQGDPFGTNCTATLSQPALGVLAIGTDNSQGGFGGTLKYAGDIVGGTSGATMAKTYVTELLTLSTGATTTATSGNLAPANSEILAITYRITTTITTAANFNVRVTGGNPFVNIGTATTSQTTLTAGTTGVLVPGAYGEGYRSTATTLTVTTNANPGAGVIRLTVFYRQFTPATS